MIQESSKYLLDTNVIIEYLRHNISIAEHIKTVGIENCAISIITLQELYWGAFEAPEKFLISELSKVEFIKQLFPILPLPTNEEFAKMKHGLKKRGMMIDDFDILIASTAADHHLIVVTDNINHFGRIEGLTIENWVKR